MNFFKYLATIACSVLLTTIVVQGALVKREREGCERRQPIFRVISDTFAQAARTLPNPPPGITTLEQLEDVKEQIPPEQYQSVALHVVLENAHDEISLRVVGSPDNPDPDERTCDTAYPLIIPWLE